MPDRSRPQVWCSTIIRTREAAIPALSLQPEAVVLEATPRNVVPEQAVETCSAAAVSPVQVEVLMAATAAMALGEASETRAAAADSAAAVEVPSVPEGSAAVLV